MSSFDISEVEVAAESGASAPAPLACKAPHLEVNAPPQVARRTFSVVGLAVVVAAPFALQFALLDLALRGFRAPLEHPRLLVNLVESGLLWTLALALATKRRSQIVLALLAAIVLVVQATVFRYYHAPIDVQVVASALHAWHDVRPVMTRAMPALLLEIGGVASLEFALLWAFHRQLLRVRGGNDRSRRGPSMLLLVLVAGCGLFGLPLRQSTPDVRLVHALLAVPREREAPVASAITLPPVIADRRGLPNVLFILTESVRAEDYVADGESPTAPETAAATPGRVDLAELRAVSSYTAVSLSAVLTGLSQEGARDTVLRAPNLFDFARATRDARGKRPSVAYFSAQSETVFETKDVRAAVDRFVTVETLRGKDVDDDAEYADLPLDRDVVDHFVAHVGELPNPNVSMLHLVGTHAPYFVDTARAPFQPFDHVVTWSRMPKLLNAYKDAIYDQDRHVARAIRAFIAHAGDAPWLIVFTSDHGEAFGEHGAIHHGQNLHDEQVHVPAWIAYGQGALTDGQAKALRDHAHRFVTHLDVLPTILDAMGLWDNFAVAPHRAAMRGRSMLRAWESRGPIPATNCTGMFPCPLNTWGTYDDDHKLVARLWDGDWACLDLRPASDAAVRASGHVSERLADPADPACAKLREASRAVYPLLPNGAPNR